MENIMEQIEHILNDIAQKAASQENKTKSKDNE